MIILSSAKTMSNNDGLTTTVDFFNKNKTQHLIAKVKELSKEELAKTLKIKGKTLENTYQYYHEFEQNLTEEAILKYKGIVFKQLQDIEGKIQKSNFKDYLNNNVYIISALYGLVNATDKIKSYRLDFTNNKAVDQVLYKYWLEDVNEQIIKSASKSILNLCSTEHFKILNETVKENIKIYNIKSKEKIDSTTLKKIRGEVLNYCIENQIYNYEHLKGVKLNLITFTDLENNNIIFVKNKG